MPTYSLHTTQPSEAVKHQVATMTGAYTADLHRYDFAGIGLAPTKPDTNSPSN